MINSVTEKLLTHWTAAHTLIARGMGIFQQINSGLLRRAHNMSKSSIKRAAAKIRKHYGAALQQRELDEQDQRDLVRQCSLGKNGFIGKGEVKSRGRATYRACKQDKYAGGSSIYTRQDGWHKSKSWVLARKP